VEIPSGGAEGMLNTLGGRFGGYGLYLVKGKPVFTYNLLALEKFRWEGKDALTPGKHIVMFDFKYDGPGMAKGGTGVLSVDGKEVDNKKIAHTCPALMTIDETFDVGVDTRTGAVERARRRRPTPSRRRNLRSEHPLDVSPEQRCSHLAWPAGLRAMTRKAAPRKD
jgi:hypothetical protein